MAAVNATSVKGSIPLALYKYTVTGLASGDNTVSLPTPPAAGSFPPLADWTPTLILVVPSTTTATPTAFAVPDTSTITNTAGLVTFHLRMSAADANLVVTLLVG